MVDEDLGIINSFSYGTTTIYAETLDGKVRSNRVFLEVLPIRRIRIAPSEVQVRVGGRQRLEAICTLADGHELRDVRLIWTENDSSIARVSSGGMVFGFALGQTEVSAADDNVTAENSAVIEVVVGEGRDQGDKPGRGFAKVLVSGIDPDPDTGEPVTFSREYPPVWQRPLDADRNIWWINSTAPLAKIYLDTSREYGYHTREWRMYHLERYIDVIAEIALRYESLDAGAKSVNEWILARGAKLAEIHIAAAEDLEAFISNGDLPGE